VVEVVAVVAWLNRVRNGFWFLPAVCAVLAVALGLGITSLDQAFAGALPFLFAGGPDGARSLLSSITSSMISFTGLVFSITIVVLQLTSSQFSPRVLRTLLQDRTSQFALGVFVATFLYAMTVQRSVRGGDGDTQEFVPQLGVTLAYGFVLLSVALFIRYIHHIANAIRAVSIITSVADEARAVIEAWPEPTPDAPTPPSGTPQRRLSTPVPGVVVSVDSKRLVRAAEAADVVLVLVPYVGDFVCTGAEVVDVYGAAADDIDEEKVVPALALDRERTMDQDAAFGFRQLIDIAERALSPGVNDPTTAVQAMDQLRDMLRRMAVRRLPDGLHCDSAGRLRVVVPQLDFADYLDLAIDEIAHYGKDSLQVRAHLAHLLRDLRDVARPEYRSAVERKISELLTAGIIDPNLVRSAAAPSTY
jgi:uncharacterized membrane protein